MAERLLTNALQAWQELGLRILPHGGTRPLTVAVGAGLAFGVYMALADATLFRNIIPASQTMLVSGTSSLHRLAYFVPLSVADEVKLRLILMSALVWMLISVAGRRPWCFWAAILGTALLVNPAFELAYLSTLAPTLFTAMREIMLHGAAGILWGYLYWRHGLVAAMAGHISAHLSLEPLLNLLFVAQ